MRIFLIRHARQESKLCNDNTHLSIAGQKQARLLGRRLKKYGSEIIYTSDLIRAEETAQIIKQESGREEMQICKRPELRETDFGYLTKMSDEGITLKYGKFMESRFNGEDDWAYPGGENGQEVFQRAIKILNEIIHSNYENICVVTHGGTIRVLLSGIFTHNQKERLCFGKCMERGGFTELFYDKEKKMYFLERFNDYGHLEEDRLLLMRKD